MKQKIRRSTERLPHEVFSKLEEISKPDDRVAWLVENGTFTIKTILQGAFDPNIVFDLPPGTPSYKEDPAPAGYQITPLHKHIQRLAKCLVSPQGSPDKYSSLKKQVIFMNLLEIAHAEDARILIAMKDKTLHKLYPSLRISLIRKAFPSILPQTVK